MRGHRIVGFVVAVAAAASLLVVPSGGFAVHDLGLLELDTTAPAYANTADDSPPVAGSNAPYDWQSIFNSNGVQTLLPATEPRLLLADFNADYPTPDPSYFASSNKDIDDVSTWECKSVNNPTPKDEIANAYSALFLNTANNHVILYAGAERDDNNGNSFMGFWIFKSGVGCSSPGNFTGAHVDGDILVLSNFTGGGAHPLVEVYKWDSGALSLIGSGSFCHSSGAGDNVCGEVNGAAFQTSWAPHNAAANPLNINEFLEVGVDLTNVLNFPVGTVPCFSRFQAETRSSQETTATLKDYAGNAFNTCSSNTVTTPRAGGTSVSGGSVIPGTAVTDRAVVTGTALTGTPPAPTGSVSFFLCGPQTTQALAKCTTGGTPVGAAVNLPAGAANPKTVDSSPVSPTAIGWYCFRAEYSGDTNYAGGSADSSLNECFQVAKLTPTVTTDIHNAAHQVVTVVEAGSTVHDFVSVAAAVGGPTPSGTVTIDWFTNNTCAGSPQSTSAALALDANGQVDATGFAKGPLAAGLYGFKAHYPGNTVYLNGDGPCEPLRVVDANIQITPATATNRIGTTHTFTAHVNVNDGTGSTNAPDGTTISFQIVSGPGAFTSANPCTTAGGTGSCTITLASSVTGVTTVSASTTLQVSGLSVTRSTNGSGANSGPATKTWVDAKITIAQSATNEVGQPHTFTVTLSKDTGGGSGFQPAAGEHVSVTLTDANGASHSAPTGSCTTAGPNTNASGQCTITFRSNSTGTVTGHASASLTIGTTTFTVETDGNAPNSVNAVKTFVDANIQITPQSATNPLSTNHTLTGHVNVDNGSGAGFVNAPDGTTIVFSIVSGPGSFVGPNSCLTAGGTGSCTVVITSSTSGTTTIRAATDVTVGGINVHRESGDAKAGDSADATKLWASARISIAPSATNEVGQPHTFTVTLEKDTGQGFVAAQGEHVDVTLTDANGASHSAPTGTCTNAGANTNAAGQCSITFTSSSAGTVTAHATSTLSVSGTSITVQTNGVAPNSGNAVKTFVDANIQITPASAINPVGTNHTLTGHVNVNPGSGFVNAPNGTTITFLIVSGPATFVGPSSCSTAGGTGSCTAVITSTTVGTNVIRAATDVTVGGLVLHRQSGDAKTGDSSDATKLFADDTARTDILNASGAVVTSVVAGTIVHDKVFVARTAGTPAAVPDPTGNVVFHRYATIDCTGTATNQTVALTPGSPSTAVSDDFAPTGNMSYAAEYLGDANYPARTGACEPLTVTPVPAPAIAIVKNPKSQTVAVGGTATFSITVTNVGNTVLTDVNVVDPLTPSCNRTKADIPALASMAPGASVTYTCTRTNVRAGFDNIATATGTPPSGPNVTASDTAPVKTKALTPKKVVKKKKPKVVSHKKPKATG